MPLVGCFFLMHNYFLLPCDNVLPSSNTEAKDKIGHLIVPLKELDSCVNDCVLFMGDKYLESCPECSEHRL